MNINWPPEETITYDAKNPTKDKGIEIKALPGGNPKKAKTVRRTDEGR